MSQQENTRHVQHEVSVRAQASDIYRLIAEVWNWPRIFPPTIHADRVDGDDTAERIRIWATANGQAKNWTSRRTLDPQALRIDFRQEVSSPPVAAMGGAWLIEQVSAEESLVRLLHDYRAVDDDPESLAWIDQAVDRNSRSELASLKVNVELALNEERTVSFEDTVRINGSAKDVYAFINEAWHWAERLPHVSRVSCTEDTPGLQELEMDTTAKDGSTHTTKSYRVCLPGRIHYKQVTLPPLLALHTGYWVIEEDAATGITTATSQHTIVINAEKVADVLGAGVSLAEAKTFARRALSTNSLATLGHAKQYAEQRA
ncbi:cyclase [Lentzea tibetensis]|uniref:Cyclase n=1 Tax=Lentzea tibetensis TaxID=2591470 RepID=A0A563ESC9_9PSEU|nr:aromatase/cyclase [Lentzea tibetensis]TWP50512.1 cyclase [Lentzea tibetensis]